MHQAPTTLPDVTLSDQDNNPVKLTDSLGQFVVIYFYPKASTPGCTQQACLLRDANIDFAAKNIKVFGVSPDLPSKLKKFATDQSLNFTLLSDTDHHLATLYGTWVEKSMYGRRYMGMARDTFIYAPDGTLIAIHRKVKPSEHNDLILKSINSYNN